MLKDGFRRTDQLFVSWAAPHKGRIYSIHPRRDVCQKLSHLIVATVSLFSTDEGMLSLI